MKINGTELIESSLAGHANPSEVSAREINTAIAMRDRRRAEEPWTLCGWGGIYRKPSQITAIVVV